LWGYSLKFRPYIGLVYGRYLQFRILEWPLIIGNWGFPKETPIDPHDCFFLAPPGFPENLSEDLRLIVEEEQKTMENEPEARKHT